MGSSPAGKGRKTRFPRSRPQPVAPRPRTHRNHRYGVEMSNVLSFPHVQRERFNPRGQRQPGQIPLEDLGYTVRAQTSIPTASPDNQVCRQSPHALSRPRPPFQFERRPFQLSMISLGYIPAPRQTAEEIMRLIVTAITPSTQAPRVPFIRCRGFANGCGRIFFIREAGDAAWADFFQRSGECRSCKCDTCGSLSHDTFRCERQVCGSCSAPGHHQYLCSPAGPCSSPIRRASSLPDSVSTGRAPCGRSRMRARSISPRSRAPLPPRRNIATAPSYRFPQPLPMAMDQMKIAGIVNLELSHLAIQMKR